MGFSLENIHILKYINHNHWLPAMAECACSNSGGRVTSDLM